MSRPVLVARLRLALRVVVLSLLILAVFWTVAFLLAMLANLVRGLPVTASGLLLRGAVCGLIAGLFVAVFHIRKETIRLPAPRRDAFVEWVEAHLVEQGYMVQVEAPDRLVFRPSVRALLFGAAIEVGLADGVATVTGPKMYLEILRHRLRVQSHLDRADRGISLQRRLDPGRHALEELRHLRGEVLEVLREADGEAACPG
jgi:hypothetical protein